jgi:hypothetical protein
MVSGVTVQPVDHRAYPAQGPGATEARYVRGGHPPRERTSASRELEPLGWLERNRVGAVGRTAGVG